jgi:hypothetical protein
LANKQFIKIFQRNVMSLELKNLFWSKENLG